MRGTEPVWITGSFDAEQNQVYWGVGNPGPDWNNEQRPGDNLYDSVIALDVDTGELEWYFQFTPNDPYDYDAVQVPVLADLNWNGMPKVMMWANRNGYFYVLDRTSGECLVAKPYVRVNWSVVWMKTAGRSSRRSQTVCQLFREIRAGQTGTRLLSVHVLVSFISVPGRITQRFIAQKTGIYPGRGLSGRWVQCAGAGAGCTDDRH